MTSVQPPTNRAHLYIGAHNGRARVELNGHDIAHQLSDMHIRLRAAALPAVTFELITPIEFEGHVIADVSEQTADTLQQLGWTPPTKDDQ